MGSEGVENFQECNGWVQNVEVSDEICMAPKPEKDALESEFLASKSR